MHNPPIKVCPSCYMCAYTGTRVCPGCGYEFYPEKRRVVQFKCNPTGPKIRYFDRQSAQALVEHYSARTHELLQKYVKVGGICELRAVLPDGQVVVHKFSIPKGLYLGQVDTYVAREAEELDRMISQAKENRA